MNSFVILIFPVLLNGYFPLFYFLVEQDKRGKTVLYVKQVSERVEGG